MNVLPVSCKHLQIEPRETEVWLIIIIFRFNATLSWYVRDQIVELCGAQDIAQCFVRDLRSFVSSS